MLGSVRMEHGQGQCRHIVLVAQRTRLSNVIVTRSVALVPSSAAVGPAHAAKGSTHEKKSALWGVHSIVICITFHFPSDCGRVPDITSETSGYFVLKWKSINSMTSFQS